jgi:hypothetical protein
MLKILIIITLSKNNKKIVQWPQYIPEVSLRLNRTKTVGSIFQNRRYSGPVV